MRTAAPWLTQVVVVLLLLGIVTAAVRFAQSHLAFFPMPGEQTTPERLGIPFTALTVETSDGERLRAWHLRREQPIARVVYFHGNGGNLSLWSDILATVWHHGFDVLAVDYRGYGVSSGSPSESGLYLDVDATLALVRDRLAPVDAPLVYWGRSLGTVMAAYAASRAAPNGVVLESGFPTMRSVLETQPITWLLSWLSSYSFPTASWMSTVRQPTLVLHGDRDDVIRYRLGQRLYEGLSGPKQFVTLPGVDHNYATPRDWSMYWDAIKMFVAKLKHGGS
jgi:fermentation-respiration switch protein FrsA (DUF1100 family)